MARISAQVILRPTSGIAKDFVTNVYHFDINEPSIPGDTNLKDFVENRVGGALVELYEDLKPDLGLLSQTGHRIKFVDIDGPRPQYPFLEVMFDFDTAVQQTSLPAECCIVSSFEASQVAGIRQSSRRGRVFIGPLNTGALTPSSGRVADTTRGRIATAFADFKAKDDDVGLSGWVWTIYSPTLGVMSKVNSGHVDNAFDTQRRRGVSSSFRSVWPSAGPPARG